MLKISASSRDDVKENERRGGVSLAVENGVTKPIYGLVTGGETPFQKGEGVRQGSP